MPNVVTSAASSTSAATIVNTEWWIKDPIDSSRDMTVDITGETFVQESEEERATYKPLGRKNPVTVSDVVHGETFQLDMEFTTRVNYDKFEVLRLSQRVLLLQRGYTNDQWYIRLGKTRRLVVTNHQPPLWRVSITAEEADAP